MVKKSQVKPYFTAKARQTFSNMVQIYHVGCQPPAKFEVNDADKLIA